MKSRILPFVLTSCIALSAACIPVFPIIPEGVTTVFILIRHAERDPGLDPPLNAEGLARAEVLRDVLGEQGVTEIYTTDLIRNRQTVEPLAEDLGLTVNLINPVLYADTTSAANVVVSRMLAENAGGTILWCGNTGTVFGTPGINEEIYERLGGTGTPPNRYQDLYVMVVSSTPGAEPHVTKAEYGAPSSLDP